MKDPRDRVDVVIEMATLLLFLATAALFGILLLLIMATFGSVPINVHEAAR